MPTLDVTFTLALPVHFAQLAAHLDAFSGTLPTLDALRLSNRFGKGPQCYINKLPVELLQRIAHYCILPKREKSYDLWAKTLRCYEGECKLIDHYDRDWAFQQYARYHDLMDQETPDEPNEDQMEDFLAESEADGSECHYDCRGKWKSFTEAVLTYKRPLLQKHFDLDIWLSNVCLGTSPSWRDESANTTVAYLTLCNRAEHKKEWSRHCSEDGDAESNFESGYRMTVATDYHATPKDIHKFKRAMRLLCLDVFVHETQSEEKVRPLSLRPITEEGPSTSRDTAASFPRPMLLVRNKVDGSDR